MTLRAALRIASQIVAVVLLTLGAANSYFATVVETCTQNAADSMLAGVLSIPLYVISFWLLLRRPLPLTIAALLIPALLVIGYEVWWTARFDYEYGIHSVAVCVLIAGGGTFEFDGREPLFLATWAALSVLGTAGIIVIIAHVIRDIRRRQN